MAKFKQKPHKGLSKRFKLSAKGKPRYKKPFAGHLMDHGLRYDEAMFLKEDYDHWLQHIERYRRLASGQTLGRHS